MNVQASVPSVKTTKKTRGRTPLRRTEGYWSSSEEASPVSHSMSSATALRWMRTTMPSAISSSAI